MVISYVKLQKDSIKLPTNITEKISRDYIESHSIRLVGEEKKDISILLKNLNIIGYPKSSPKYWYLTKFSGCKNRVIVNVNSKDIVKKVFAKFEPYEIAEMLFNNIGREDFIRILCYKSVKEPISSLVRNTSFTFYSQDHVDKLSQDVINLKNELIKARSKIQYLELENQKLFLRMMGVKNQNKDSSFIKHKKEEEKLFKM